MLAYERTHGESRVRVALNFGDAPCVVDLGREPVLEALRTERGRTASDVSGRLELGPSEGAVLVLD